MQIVALASAKEAGIHVPDSVLNGAVKYVLRCHNPATDGGFAYQPGGESGLARTAAGVLSLMMSGQRNLPAVQRGLEYLNKQPNSKFREVGYYYYSHYYAIQCMYQGGDQHYQPWYPNIRDALLERQRSDGSWPEEYRSGAAFNTSISILVLGVPYRFLPIYQR